MAGKEDAKRFPEISSKLAAPPKKSFFERQKAEAEAKRLKEEAETAAVFEDFVKYIDEDPSSAPVASPTYPRSTSANKAHQTSAFSEGLRKNDRPGAQDHGPSFSLKRAHDGTRFQNDRYSDRQKDRGLFAFDEPPAGPLSAAAAFRENEKEDDGTAEARAAEKAARKPTLKLSSLPPGTSQAIIRGLIPPNLAVDAVRIVPPPGPGNSAANERKSMTAIVTLGSDTPASEIDAAVNNLKNRYLGWGYYLDPTRHLSSSNTSSIASIYSSSIMKPFGAQPISQGSTLSRAPPPPGVRPAFAPPTSYAPGAAARAQQPAVQVVVTPPSSIKQLRLINKTIELLIRQGPAFEALLMSRPEVQRDEKWAWIWDPRSQGGVWYRWRLWQIVSGAYAERKPAYDQFGNTLTASQPRQRQIFHGAAPWLDPGDDLPYEFAIKMQQMVLDSAYNSSDEASDDEAERKRQQQNSANVGSLGPDLDSDSYLNPMEKAKLTHLLMRLPQSTGKLRKGDLARVMAFAIDHAGSGGEVVEILISNILHPFNMREAETNTGNEHSADGLDTATPNETGDIQEDPNKAYNRRDTSAGSLIGLYCILDILAASSTSGVRGAWRYRSLFEQALLQKHVFARLGRLEKYLGWGRLKIEKWHRSVRAVFNAWEMGSVFGQNGYEKMLQEFEDPPQTEQEKELEQKEKAEKKKQEKSNSKWKTVEVNVGIEQGQDLPSIEQQTMPSDQMDARLADLDGAPVDNLDGEQVEDIDGEAVGNLDGTPMDMDNDATQLQEDTNLPDSTSVSEEPKPLKSEAKENSIIRPKNETISVKRQRPKAVDMFADSDEDA